MKFVKKKIKDFAISLGSKVLMEIMIKIIGLKELRVWRMSLKEERDVQNALI